MHQVRYYRNYWIYWYLANWAT